MSNILECPVARESFVVRNVHCARCAGTLERTLSTLPGVVSVHVDPIVGWTRIDYASHEVSGHELHEAIEAGGYEIVTAWSDTRGDSGQGN